MTRFSAQHLQNPRSDALELIEHTEGFGEGRRRFRKLSTNAAPRRMVWLMKCQGLCVV